MGMAYSSEELATGALNQYRGIGGGNMGMQNMNAPPPPKITIPETLDEQQKELARLHQTIDNLTDRLLLVLAPEGAGGTLGKDPSPSPPSVLQRLRDHNRALSLASSRLEELLGRLQL